MYRILNSTQELMSIPFRQVVLAMTYIRGEKVDDRVDAQATSLAEKIQAPRLIDKTDKVLWDEFKRDFLAMYTDTAWEQDAHNKLTNLSMQGRDIDSYIATFNHLAVKVGYSLLDKGTTDRFKKGLP